MKDSIFTKIIRGDIPSHKLYEDDYTFVFLNIYPSVAGHILVIPKVQVDHLEALDENVYQAVMATTRLMMKRVVEVLGVERACIKVEGFEVPHAHVHVLPCNTPADFTKPQTKEEPDHVALEAVAEKLRIV